MTRLVVGTLFGALQDIIDWHELPRENPSSDESDEDSDEDGDGDGSMWWPVLVLHLEGGETEGPHLIIICFYQLVDREMWAWLLTLAGLQVTRAVTR